jgi:hypothetical protein
MKKIDKVAKHMNKTYSLRKYIIKYFIKNDIAQNSSIIMTYNR